MQARAFARRDELTPPLLSDSPSPFHPNLRADDACRLIRLKLRVLTGQPLFDFFEEPFSKANQLVGVGCRGSPRHIVFDSVPLDPADVEVSGIRLLGYAQNERQRLQRGVVGQILVWPVSGGDE